MDNLTVCCLFFVSQCFHCELFVLFCCTYNRKLVTWFDGLLLMQIPGVGVLRQNHKKLMRACAPSDSHSDPNTFYSTVNDSGWLDNV